MRMLSAVKKSLNRAGIDVRRYHDSLKLASYAKLYTKEQLDRKPFYNIGAGAFSHPYWTNIDFASDRYAETQGSFINYDITACKSLPIDNNSALIFYTSHTIEHVPESSVLSLFKEVHRCLHSGGIFRITTGPDAETDFRAMQNDDHEWFYWYDWYNNPKKYRGIFNGPAGRMSIEEKWLQHVFSRLINNSCAPSPIKFTQEQIRKSINDLGFPGVLEYFSLFSEFDPDFPHNHVSWWTHDKIENYLKMAGFSNIYRSGYQQSASPVMRGNLFDSVHPQISIYIEAIA